MLTGDRAVGERSSCCRKGPRPSIFAKALCASSTARQMVEYLENRCDCSGTRDDTAIRCGSLAVPDLKSRNLELRSAIQDSYRKANPRGAVVDVEKQLNRQLSEFAGGDGVAAFTPRLVDVVTATLAHDGRVTSVNYSAGQLRLNLTADNFAAVERIRQQLEQSGLKATLNIECSRRRSSSAPARGGVVMREWFNAKHNEIRWR